MRCTTDGCANEWPGEDGGDRWSGCEVEGVCLEHCTDFAGHVSLVPEVEVEHEREMAEAMLIEIQAEAERYTGGQ